MKFVKTIILLFVLLNSLYAQSIDIVPTLRKIKQGKIQEAKTDLEKFKRINPNSADLIYLEAVLTEDGAKAQKLYDLISKTFPASKFADAALFNTFSYYYALGLYKRASEIKTLLASKYPNSKYIKKTNRDFPITDDVVLISTEPYKLKKHKNTKFTVQVGAFGNLQNAEKLRNKLVMYGYTSKIKPKNVNGKTLHVVTVGAFGNRTEANNMLNILKSKHNILGRISLINND